MGTPRQRSKRRDASPAPLRRSKAGRNNTKPPRVALPEDQKFPLTFELANLATTVGVRHGLVSLGAQQYYSGGCLVGETTVKGGMLFERVLIGYGPVGNISASSGLFIFLDMAR